MPQIHTRDTQGNQGIAKALKVGTEKAIDENFDYFLFMCQRQLS